jgi:glycosyltransferase involved in cell wall biosynthesis
MNPGMISVVIPALNAQSTLPSVLTALVPAAVDGLVKELVLVDAGSTDATLAIAEDAGARVIAGPPGEAERLALGCAAAKGPWLLILRDDVKPGEGWEAVAAGHLARGAGRAGYFRFAREGRGLGARMAELASALRSSVTGGPAAGQGLLIARSLYDEVGRRLPLASGGEGDLIKRLGRGRVTALEARVIRLMR